MAKFAEIKQYLGFTLALICIFALFALSYFHDEAVASDITMIFGLYIGARTMEKGNAAWAASRDPNCNTKEVIASVTDR